MGVIRTAVAGALTLAGYTAPAEGLHSATVAHHASRGAPVSASHTTMASSSWVSPCHRHHRSQRIARRVTMTSDVTDTLATHTSESENQQLDRFHVHFGAGRLGLGLVVGAIAQSETPFAIIQRPKHTWKEITKQGCGAQVDLKVNDNVIVPGVMVVTEECDVEEYLSQVKGPGRMLAVVNDKSTLMQLVRKATSFSCSLGPAMRKVMVPLFSELPDLPDGERPILYACENDHDLVRKLGESVSSKVDTVACMVDRICTGRTIGAEGIVVQSEPGFEGNIVVLSPPDDHSKVPLSGTQVTLPRGPTEASYFYKRKFSIVNGMHTVLAFMTLRTNDAGAQECKDYNLVSPRTAPAPMQKEIWAWIVVRCLMLLEEYGLDMLKSAHGVDSEEQVFDELLGYARQTLDRFSSIADSTSRVLGGGVGNRWATRLRPVSQFLRERSYGEDTVGSRFLKHADVDYDFAKDTVNGLMMDSMQFCTKEVQECVQGLVEFYSPQPVGRDVGDSPQRDVAEETPVVQAA